MLEAYSKLTVSAHIKKNHFFVNNKNIIFLYIFLRGSHKVHTTKTKNCC